MPYAPIAWIAVQSSVIIHPTCSNMKPLQTDEHSLYSGHGGSQARAAMLPGGFIILMHLRHPDAADASRNLPSAAVGWCYCDLTVEDDGAGLSQAAEAQAQAACSSAAQGCRSCTSSLDTAARLYSTASSLRPVPGQLLYRAAHAQRMCSGHAGIA